MNSSGSLLGTLASITLVPFIALNFLAGIVGGVWLLVLGEWVVVVGSVLAILFARNLIGFLLLPTMALAMLLSYLHEKKKVFLMSIVAWINLSITQIILLAWAFCVFLVMLGVSGEVNTLPFLLLGYAVATGPIAAMARNEGPDATGSYAGAWLVQVSYVIFASFYLLGILPYAIWLVLGLALVIAFYLVKTANLFLKAEQEYDSEQEV